MTKRILIIIGAFLLLAILFFTCIPSGKAAWNNWFFQVQKADDATNYETIKKVEDTCRAMQATYEADRLTYEQFKDSDNPVIRALLARPRFERTALPRVIINMFWIIVSYGLEMFLRISNTNFPILTELEERVV